jgi:Ca-activated chloride channel family protein
MEQVRSNGEARELTEEITDLGTRYGIVTPYTSYLALEDGMKTDETVRVTPGGPRDRQPMRRERGAVGGGATSTAPMSAPAPQEAAKARTGELAVRESRRARAQQEATRADDSVGFVFNGADADAPRAAVRKVGDKTFYLREGVWTDAEFKPEARLPETALGFGSDEYFALVGREPELARFLSLGERVVVVFKGRVYRVNAATK